MMLKTIKVKKVWKVKNTGVRIIFYDDFYTDGKEHVAACAENLYPDVGDKVEIYTDGDVNYRGYGAIALKIVEAEQKKRKKPKIKTVQIKKIKRNQATGVMFVSYDDADGGEKLAAGVEYLHPSVGDMVEVYADSYVNYHGFGAMAFKKVG